VALMTRCAPLRPQAGPGGAAGPGPGSTASGGGAVIIRGPDAAAVSRGYLRAQLAMQDAIAGR
jgi:hypothetical protein